MKPAAATTFGSILVLMTALSGCKGNQAPDATPGATPAVATAPAAAMPAPDAMPAAPAEAAAIAIPDSADGIWQAIDEHGSELKAAIDAGAMEAVHHHAFAIRDLVAALPAHSPTLSPEDMAKLQGEVKFVATLAGRLDETGDAGDKAGTQANFEKLATVLNGMNRYK